ncbi:3473_t:CDS:2 [Ambispora gerdemannii]|uniref:3473_t:CDS:1 n=1 Tax=Ambispora gerdemannii TaxID=144530 RepID=A0A9N8ZGA0_9GLOM|nr:3473_t:CDS:2 [Ambispora gerdemannii]
MYFKASFLFVISLIFNFGIIAAAPVIAAEPAPATVAPIVFVVESEFDAQLQAAEAHNLQALVVNEDEVAAANDAESAQLFMVNEPFFEIENK